MAAHIPQRECICCREKFPKAELLRIVKNETGIFPDKTGKAQGRGAYLCRACVKSPDLSKKRPLSRAFRQPVEDSVYASLTENA